MVEVIQSGCKIIFTTSAVHLNKQTKKNIYFTIWNFHIKWILTHIIFLKLMTVSRCMNKKTLLHHYICKCESIKEIATADFMKSA